MLIEIAIGDAYGRPFEFERQVHLMKNDVRNYKTRPGDKKSPMGKYTDDTQMSIAIAEAMLHSNASSQEDFAKHFIKAWSRDIREGYSKRIFGALAAGKITYFKLDTQGMFKESVRLAVLNAIDEITEAKGIRALSESARREVEMA